MFLTAGNFAQSNPRGVQDKPEKSLPLTSYIVLITIDGLRNEDLQDPKIKLPILKSLWERGSYALNVESVYPSQSLPAHATMVTGMFPSDHGVVSDKVFDERAGKTLLEQNETAASLKSATIWQIAKRAGLKTAMVNFPFTKEAVVDFNSQNISTALAWIEKNRPQLVLFRIEELANAIQQFGRGSGEATTVLETIDSSVRKILETIERAGLTNETTFLIVSSHGHARVQQEFRPNVILAKKGLLKLDTKGNIAEWEAVAHSFGGAAAIYLKDVKNEVAAKEVEAIFAEIQKSESSPIWRIISRQDAAKLGADPRAAFFIEAAPGFVISEQGIGKKITGKLSKTEPQFTSGYVPSRSEMRGMLILNGKGIKPQTIIEYARLTDIAPTMARLLGLELKVSRGHALSELMIQSNQK